MALGDKIVVDIFLAIISFFIAGLSLSAGVGGGGLYVPLIIMFLWVDARTATALSQSMLCGGAVAAFVYNASHRHPNKPHEPLADFQLACLMGSALMGGAQLGSVVHEFAPPALLLVLLVLVLAQSAVKSLKSSRKLRAQEEAKKPLDGGTQELAIRSTSNLEQNHEESSGVALSSGVGYEGLLRSVGAKRKLGLVWVICIGLVLLKGLALKKCSPWWWVLTLGASGFLGGLSYFFAKQMSQQTKIDEFSLDYSQLAVPLALKSYLAGILASVCGIGGGMIMGPILVELRVPPPVSAATTATTLLVLSSSTGLVYWCRGSSPLDYSICLSLITLVGAGMGKTLVGRWVRRTGKDSVLVVLMLVITVTSAVVMGILGIYRMWEQGGKAFQFNWNFCDSNHTVTTH